MKSRAAIAALAAIAAMLAVGAGPSQGKADRVVVGLRNAVGQEFVYYTRRTKIPPGPGFVQYTNTGEDPHNLLMQKSDETGARFEDLEILPGGVAQFEGFRFRNGQNWTLWCSLEGHREAGMEVTLRVRKPNRGR